MAMVKSEFVLRSNGSLMLCPGWRGAWQELEITGGPYDYYDDELSKDPDWFGFCVRAEHANSFDARLPIHDFSVPKGAITPQVVNREIQLALRAALNGQNVYVGCMGGWGRTGLVLALMVKVALPDVDPVTYVRAHYTPRAVETSDQKAYVSSFDVTQLRRAFYRDCWKARLGLKV